MSTPAGIHHITMDKKGKHYGTFQPWNDFNQPSREESRLIRDWDLGLTRFQATQTCRRQHRTAAEARACTGQVQAVIQQSPIPSSVRQAAARQMRARTRPLPRGLGTIQPRGNSKNQARHLTLPKAHGNIYHLKSSATDPMAAIQVHPPPRSPKRLVKTETTSPSRVRWTYPRAMPQHQQQQQQPMACMTQTDRMTKGAQGIVKLRKEMSRNIGMIREVAEESNKLMDLFLCKEKELRDLGILQASPLSEEEQPQGSQTHPIVQAGACTFPDDPAVIVIQPPPSPIPTESSSVPSLISCISEEEEVIITKVVPGRHMGARPKIKEEGSDSSDITNLTNNTQNLLL
ncbi:MAG: hypothetical protein MJE68_01020 [Proteobacteria bacterium]|nr:hypothetical protein [Pseudomonadota bacterium]